MGMRGALSTKEKEQNSESVWVGKQTPILSKSERVLEYIESKVITPAVRGL